jgi:hypothetical protein
MAGLVTLLKTIMTEKVNLKYPPLVTQCTFPVHYFNHSEVGILGKSKTDNEARTQRFLSVCLL